MHTSESRELAKPRESSTQMAAQNPLLVVYETPSKAGGRASTGFNQKERYAKGGRQRIV